MEAPAGQHIFPLGLMTDLCKEWRKLTEANQHVEAQALLEDIIKECTNMFERLAQYEGFTQTVDLDTLVQSAREKVVRWLLGWDKKRSLFTYFSVCLTGDTRITLADGTLQRIDEIVEGRKQVQVRAWDEKTRQFITAQVVDWHKYPTFRASWRKFSVKPARGHRRLLYLTFDHPVFTQRGWVEVDQLRPRDVAYVYQRGSLQPATISRRPLRGKTNIAKRGRSRWFTPDFNWRYDVTVAGAGNFIAEGVLVHNCARNAFLSEVNKTNLHRRRFHATSDTLEKFFGVEDHATHRHDAAREARRQVQEIAVRWGNPYEIGAVRLAIECLIDDREEHDREAAIRSVCYGFGLSPELGHFFYGWGLFALRNAMYDRVRVPFTREDLLRHRHSYTHLVDLLDIITWEQFKRLIATLGGQRLRIPTLSQLSRLHEDYLLTQRIEHLGGDPSAVEQGAKEFNRATRTAQEIYEEMQHELNQDRSGEHYLYELPEENN